MGKDNVTANVVWTSTQSKDGIYGNSNFSLPRQVAQDRTLTFGSASADLQFAPIPVESPGRTGSVKRASTSPANGSPFDASNAESVQELESVLVALDEALKES